MLMTASSRGEDWTLDTVWALGECKINKLTFVIHSVTARSRQSTQPQSKSTDAVR